MHSSLDEHLYEINYTKLLTTIHVNNVLAVNEEFVVLPAKM
jgi:hypothetical protein